MARKFLYVIAGLIVLALASALAYRIWGQQLLNSVMVPTASFAPLRPLTEQDYARDDMWIASPRDRTDNPALWLPAGVARQEPGPAAVFFIHPTSYVEAFNKAQWNMPIGDRESLYLTTRLVEGQASVFSAAGEVWVPVYRQAHLGAFLSDKPAADQSLSAAYGDVSAAFTAFLAANPDRPIILAGHSQGALHLLRLLKERAAGTPVAGRIAAVYAVGWPVSVEADIPALGLPACTRRAQPGCILSWQSFAEPADPRSVEMAFIRKPGYAGKPRVGTHILCVNPLTGSVNAAASARQNLGTLSEDARDGERRLVKAAVPARCDKSGFLLIGDPPRVGDAVLPGNNYHVYDYALFWANVRRDVAERLSAFLKH